MLRTSEEYWDWLQREYRRAVGAEYPNPGRKDCPGTDALRDLAERKVRRQDLRTDRRWKHAMQCGPCYEAYIALRYLRWSIEDQGASAECAIREDTE